MELRFFLFVVLIYMEYWFRAPTAASAPHSDLQFIKKLHSYHDIDCKIEEAIRNHLWYLTEDFMGLAFFCNDVPDEIKLAMLSALQKPARKQTVKQLEAKNIAGKIGNMELDDFLRRDPENCFKTDSAFMTDHPPQTWSGLAEYKNTQ